MQCLQPCLYKLLQTEARCAGYHSIHLATIFIIGGEEKASWHMHYIQTRIIITAYPDSPARVGDYDVILNAL